MYMNGPLASTCKSTNDTLQICNGKLVNLKRLPEEQILVFPTLTFVNLANIDSNEKTVTVFVSLKLNWNDTSITRHG